MKFRFLDPAEEEMTEAARIYEDQTVGLGERFPDEVEGCTANPLRGLSAAELGRQASF